MSQDDAVIQDILAACRLIAEFRSGLDQREFMEDRKTQSAVLHQIMIIGEAVKKLSEEFRKKHARVPWKEIAGMRDKLIHAYNEVDLDEVWDTINIDVPELMEFLQDPQRI